MKRHAVEHHIRESFLFVARYQPAEDRVAVETGKAPPHHARFRIDERRRAPVANDSEVEPMNVLRSPYLLFGVQRDEVLTCFGALPERVPFEFDL